MSDATGYSERPDARQPERILVVDDDRDVRTGVQAVLEAAGFSVEGVQTTGEALDRLSRGSVALVLLDLRLPGNGINLLAELQKHHPDVATIVMTGYASLDSAIDAIRLGAYDYLTKPVHPEMLRLAVRHGLDRIRFTRGQQLLRALQRSDADLRRRNSELIALQAVWRTVSQADTVERLLGDVIEQVVEVFGVEVGLISVLDPRTQERVTSASRGLPSPSAALFTKKRVAEGTPTRRLIGSREPVVIDDLSREPNLNRAFREVTSREHLVTYFGAPVRSHGRALAVIELASRVSRVIAPEELRLLELISGQIASALENSQLVERLLEREARLQQLSVRILRAQEEERRRIARDLHDETAQSLTTLKLMIEMIRKALPPERDDLRKQTREADTAVGRMLQDIRRLIADLRPTMLDDFGLVPTLKWLVHDASQRYGFRVELQVGDSQRRLARDVETLLYRAVQEALTNVVKHARAALVRIALEWTGDRVIVTVQDNGVGFSGRPPRRGGLGLPGLRERLAEFGGSLWVESQRGRGTTLTMSIPLRRRPDAVNGG